jgi:hypothetical protein
MIIAGVDYCSPDAESLARQGSESLGGYIAQELLMAAEGKAAGTEGGTSSGVPYYPSGAGLVQQAGE